MNSSTWLMLPGIVLMACGHEAPPAPAPPTSATHEHGHEHEHGGFQHRFDNAEKWAKEFDDPSRDAWQKPADVIAAMDLRPGMTVADIGAGTGYFEPWLSRAVGEKGTVLALDVEPDMVRYLGDRAAREKLTNVHAALVPLDNPKLPAALEGPIDRVLIVDTWHHVGDREAYAAKVRAGLAPGGKVFVVDFTLEAKHGPPPKHRLAPEQVVRELAAGGLTAQVSPTALPEQYIVVGTRP